MLIFIENTPRAYSWGSRDALALTLGTQPTGEPQAELWLGSHPGAPATVAKATPGRQTLIDLIESDPERYGVAGGPLPFLLKVLAIGAPLSLQVHPDLAQAAAGFAAEEAAGVARDARERNYGDANHKPELLVALTDVTALSGFRPIAEVVQDLGALQDTARLAGIDPAPLAVVTEHLRREAPESGRRSFLEWVFGGSAEAAKALEVLEAAVQAASASETAADTENKTERSTDTEIELDQARLASLGTLVATHPGDPGVFVSLLLHLVHLAPGDAIFLAARQLHAYLSGVAVEVMAASDNVLRAGLTEKHVDIAELCRVVDTTELEQPRFEATRLERGLTAWRPPVDDFQLLRVRVCDPEAVDAGAPRTPDSAPRVQISAPHPLVVVVIRGSVRIERIDADLDEVANARRGQSLYISAGAPIVMTGHGEAFIAAVGEGFDRSENTSLRHTARG